MANQSPSALEQSVLTKILSREKTGNPAAVEMYSYQRIIDTARSLKRAMDTIALRKNLPNSNQSNQLAVTYFAVQIPNQLRALKTEISSAAQPLDASDVGRMLTPLKEVAAAFVKMMASLGVKDIRRCKATRLKCNYIIAATRWSPKSIDKGKAIEYGINVCDELLYNITRLAGTVRQMTSSGSVLIEEDAEILEWGKDREPIGEQLKPSYTEVNTAATALIKELRAINAIKAKKKNAVTMSALYTRMRTTLGRSVQKLRDAVYTASEPQTDAEALKLITPVRNAVKEFMAFTKSVGISDITKCTTVRFKTKYMVLLTGWTPQQCMLSGRAYDYVKKTCDELLGDVAPLKVCVSMMVKSRQYKVECGGEIDEEINDLESEDSVGDLMPVTMPNEVLRKPELGKPDADEAFDALNIGLDLTKPNVSGIIEEVEEKTADDPFIYDEDGMDIMPFTTDILFVNEDGEPMISWEKASCNPYMEAAGKSRYVALDRASLQIIEKYAASNLKGKGYIPFKSLSTTTAQKQVRCGKNGVYTFLMIKSVYKKQNVVTVTVWQKDTKDYDLMSSSITPKMTLTGFLAYVNICDKYKVITPQTNKKLKKYAAQITEGKFRKKDRLILESENTFYDALAANGIQSVIEEDASDETYLEVWEDWDDDEIMNEAAKIDDDIARIIGMLNSKGYTTVYSCSGHPSARLKSDTHRDGVKNGKLYSSARVVFDKEYNFSSYPDGWEPKVMDDGKFGIYVKGPHFNIAKGMPKDQFANWKKRYMNHLETWANSLPPASASKKK